MNTDRNLSSLPRPPSTDLSDAVADVAAGRRRAADEVERSLRSAAGLGPTFLRRFDTMARAAAAAVDAQRAAGAPVPPLAGLAVSVKALFDVAGAPSDAASQSMDDAPAAAADCPAVARLRAAGAAIVGHTNLTEFAFSGVGINPHFGTPPNPAALVVDATPRIPGGSTSGGATSVAGGAAWAALGSDTRGSIRVPAALQGLVGFKNTQSLTPLEGCVPLSFTLDTTCAITRSVRDAVLVHEIVAARRVALRGRPMRGLRLALPVGEMLDGLDATVARAFDRALAALLDAGAELVELALPAPGESAAVASGRISAAEAWAWHRARLDDRAQAYDPRVLARVRMGSGVAAADYIDLLRRRREWIAQVEALARPFDAFVCPTVPVVAPPLQPLLADDDAFFATNARLLRNPSLVNHLDGCAITLPCHAPDELPAGLMLFAPAHRDDALLDAALAVEAAIAGR